MSRAALIVRVPEAEAMVAQLRERFDESARLGVPAHITVLFPFAEPDRIDAPVLARIERVVAGSPAFGFLLAHVGRFPATAYLAPEPAAPFVALTRSLVGEFPEFPAFAGEFPAVVPHLTVAHGNAADAEFAQAQLVIALAAQGPISCVCDSLTLLEDSSGRWRVMRTFALAG